jgi:hypothetical protein
VRDSSLHRRIIEDLFYEQEHDALSNSYRHGLLRTAFVLARSLLFSRRSREPELIRNGEVVAVAFFENELAAVKRAESTLRFDRILRFDLRSLSVVRAQLGWVSTLAELWYFFSLAVQLKGLAYLQRSSIPALGWLVYRTFQHMLAGRSNVTVLTTNMVHPTSLGVTWAAVGAGQGTLFYEHATTPQIIMRDRGYGRVYVNFHHTCASLVAKGFDAQRIEVMQPPLERPVAVLPSSVRTAAFCINSYDSLASISDVVQVLKAHDLKVIVRIHDADPRVREVRAMSEQLDFEVDLARASKIQDFFQRVELVVTGNSNVIADALIAGRAVIYFWAGQPNMFDYYGFVQHYQLAYATGVEELQRLMTKLMDGTRRC